MFIIRICFYTLGCKVNQTETGAMEKFLSSRGHSIVSCGEDCDAVVINTCAVTAASGRKSRQAITRLRQSYPEAILAVCGCLPPSGGLPETIEGVHLIGGPSNRLEFALELEKIQMRQKSVVFKMDEEKDVDTEPFSAMDGRTRAFLKIQDGCENYCCYCIIPFLRGNCRSRSQASAIEQAIMAQDAGFKELVLTGIEISSYKPSLCELVMAVCGAAAQMRIRLGSLEPTIIREETLLRWKTLPNLCPHFHLSLQSGSDAILKRMNRHYTSKEYYQALGILRNHFPGCAVTTDLICGFPGETEEHWAETMAFIEKAEFAAIHIFPYSRRKGTVAAEMPGQISMSVKKERAASAASIAKKSAAQYRFKQIGRTLHVLTETEYEGRAENYQKVRFYEKQDKNRIYSTVIVSEKEEILYGIAK